MSDKYFYNKFSSALTDIIELYQTEQAPSMVKPNQKSGSAPVAQSMINFFIPIYVKYIDVLKRMEDSYDQTTHPQIRKVMKKFLENLMCRIVQLKQDLIYYHYPFPNIYKFHYFFINDYLFDLKLTPDAFDIVIPRYLREESEEIMNRNILIDQRLIGRNGDCLAENDIKKVFFNINLNMEDAVRIIQNFELGRQNLKRIGKSLKLAHKILDNDLGTEKKILMEDEKKKLVVEHLVSLHKIKRAKEDELKFLKMIPDDKVETEVTGSKLAEENRKQRKLIQKEKQDEYDNYKNDMSNNIILMEKYDIQQGMIKERKDWLESDIQNNNGKVPQHMGLFYDAKDVNTKDILDDSQQKAKDDIEKAKLKKLQEKKKKDESGPSALQSKKQVFIYS
jgi:hypothetical protein